VANYPSWDRFVFAVHPRLGIKSLADVSAKRIPLRLSTREDPTHSTRSLIDQTLALYGFSIAELERWGGSLQLNGGPGDARRLQAMSEGSVDAIHAREAEIVWENFNQWAPYKGIGALGEETEATPRDVPLHPGAARWFREHGFKV